MASSEPNWSASTDRIDAELLEVGRRDERLDEEKRLRRRGGWDKLLVFVLVDGLLDDTLRIG